jgi:short-subunit dehydrogenase
MKLCVLNRYGPGVGAAAARRRSQGGFAVALVWRTKEKLDAAARRFPTPGSLTISIRTPTRGSTVWVGVHGPQSFATDVSDPTQLVTTLGAIEADMRPIAALIYNAGNGVWKTYDEITVDQVSVPRLCAHALHCELIALPHGGG